MGKPEHWAVTVEADGEKLVTIESNCLAGKAELSDQDEAVIRNAAEHLLAFLGHPPPPEPAPKLDWRLSDETIAECERIEASAIPSSTRTVWMPRANRARCIGSPPNCCGTTRHKWSGLCGSRTSKNTGRAGTGRAGSIRASSSA